MIDYTQFTPLYKNYSTKRIISACGPSKLLIFVLEVLPEPPSVFGALLMTKKAPLGFSELIQLFSGAILIMPSLASTKILHYVQQRITYEINEIISSLKTGKMIKYRTKWKGVFAGRRGVYTAATTLHGRRCN